MVPKIHARGTSFKGASTYLLHDKRDGETKERGVSFKGASTYLLHDKNAQTSDRVAWTHSANLWGRPEDAWFEMMDTWQDRANLKRAAGVPLTGRDNKNPVLHMSLSWHPDEAPAPEHMKATALDALKALGLQEHQALIVAHNDEPHPHVHILVNTVHPQTGKTASLSYSKEKLSRWAEAYEREHGIHCDERIKNNERRDALRKLRAREKHMREFAQTAGRRPELEKPYEPVKDRSPSRQEWFDKQAVIARMKAMRAELTGDQKQERDTLWLKHQAERAAEAKAAVDRAEIIRQNVKDTYRPKWQTLYRAQATEKRFLAKVATHPLERACFVIANRDRLAPEGKRLSLRDIASLIVSPKRLMKRVESVHERERRSLARDQKSLQASVTERALTTHRAQWRQTNERQIAERAALKSHHQVERNDITFAKAKATLAAEQFAKVQDASSPLPRRETIGERAERMRREIRDIQRRRDGPDKFERER